MAKKNGKELLQELKEREKANVTTRIASVRGRINTRLVSLVPSRLQWMVPWLQEEIQERAANLLKKDEQDGTQTEQITSFTEIAYPVETPLGGKPLYQKYRCLSGNPLACEFPQQTVQQQLEAKYCLQCGFPAILAPDAKIQGSRGTYQVESLLGYRGKGRLYQALQLPDRQPVVIKEYLLPERYFNQEEAIARKVAFKPVAGMGLADGRVQDFRLISPADAIADQREERCYLVTKGSIDAFPTLASYLVLNGPMTSRQVRGVLNQVLQSLEFLHGQKFRLPSGLVKQGLTHGNISLDSLLIAPNFQGFFIYLSDLALWENLFNLPLAQSSINSVPQDLKDVAYIAFYLLAGGTVDPISGQPLDPRVEQHWPPVNFALKEFILNLAGLGLVTFESAELARQALLKLPPENRELPPLIVESEPEEEEKSTKRSRLRFLLFGALGLLLLGILIWFFTRRDSQSNAVTSDPLPCCIKQVSGIPSGKFTYTAERDGTWSYVLKRENLITLGEPLEAILQRRQPKLKLTYRPENSPEEAIAKVRSQETAFAITSLIGDLGGDLNDQKFAYDGLVVFVSFSYARRENSLPQALQGQISFEQLRQLYTGQISKWKQLDNRFPDLPVKLYIPAEDEAVKVFEQRVLKEQQAIDSFRRLIRKNNPVDSFATTSVNPTITPLRTFDTLREVIRDFENRGEGRSIGSIAFGSISKVFGQCSVYPLALAEGNNSPVSPLVYNDETPVTPETDLCNDKGSYRPNIKGFINQRYPLAYPIAVVYPRDNRRETVGKKFAEILRTVEAQSLLSKTGLVPLQPLE
jgi:hypothetical protein